MKNSFSGKENSPSPDPTLSPPTAPRFSRLRRSTYGPQCSSGVGAHGEGKQVTESEKIRRKKEKKIGKRRRCKLRGGGRGGETAALGMEKAKGERSKKRGENGRARKIYMKY